jgi:hypothetical protein
MLWIGFSSHRSAPRAICEGKMPDDDLQNLLAALVEQARALATRIAGDPERETPCHFCGSPLSLWENLLVMQLTGVGAHVECPADALEKKLIEVGPAGDFPYAEFSRAVEERLQSALPTVCSGTIERPPLEGLPIERPPIEGAEGA